MLKIAHEKVIDTSFVFWNKLNNQHKSLVTLADLYIGRRTDKHWRSSTFDPNYEPNDPTVSAKIALWLMKRIDSIGIQNDAVFRTHCIECLKIDKKYPNYVFRFYSYFSAQGQNYNILKTDLLFLY